MRTATLPPSTTVGCIPWTGKKHGYGYGSISRNGERYLTHRVAWERAFGPIPPGMVVMHECDNPPCYRLSHLRLGTYRDNFMDAVAKGRQRLMPRYYGEGHGRAKITEAQVREIRDRLAGGEKPSQLATEYGVSVPLMYAIRVRRIWKHVA